MTIPPQTKSAFWVSVVIAVVVGFVLGLIVVGSMAVLAPSQLGTAQDTSTTPVAELTPAQIQEAVALTPNKQLYGTVTAKGLSGFTLEAEVQNPLDGTSTSTAVAVPFDSAVDTIMSTASLATSTDSTTYVAGSAMPFSSLTVGSFVLLDIVNGKKTVYVISQ